MNTDTDMVSKYETKRGSTAKERSMAWKASFGCGYPRLTKRAVKR